MTRQSAGQVPQMTDGTFIAGLVKTSIAAHDEATRVIARDNLKSMLKNQPELVGFALISLQKAAEDAHESIRKGVQQTLCSLIETCPDIVDAALITHTAKIAVSDCNKSVRDAAQRTLETLTWAIPHWEWTAPYSE